MQGKLEDRGTLTLCGSQEDLGILREAVDRAIRYGTASAGAVLGAEAVDVALLDEERPVPHQDPPMQVWICARKAGLQRLAAAIWAKMTSSRPGPIMVMLCPGEEINGCGTLRVELRGEKPKQDQPEPAPHQVWRLPAHRGAQAEVTLGTRVESTAGGPLGDVFRCGQTAVDMAHFIESGAKCIGVELADGRRMLVGETWETSEPRARFEILGVLPGPDNGEACFRVRWLDNGVCTLADLSVLREMPLSRKIEDAFAAQREHADRAIERALVGGASPSIAHVLDATGAWCTRCGSADLERSCPGGDGHLHRNGGPCPGCPTCSDPEKPRPCCGVADPVEMCLDTCPRRLAYERLATHACVRCSWTERYDAPPGDAKCLLCRAPLVPSKSAEERIAKATGSGLRRLAALYNVPVIVTDTDRIVRENIAAHVNCIRAEHDPRRPRYVVSFAGISFVMLGVVEDIRNEPGSMREHRVEITVPSRLSVLSSLIEMFERGGSDDLIIPPGRSVRARCTSWSDTKFVFHEDSSAAEDEVRPQPKPAAGQIWVNIQHGPERPMMLCHHEEDGWRAMGIVDGCAVDIGPDVLEGRHEWSHVWRCIGIETRNGRVMVGERRRKECPPPHAPIVAEAVAIGDCGVWVLADGDGEPRPGDGRRFWVDPEQFATWVKVTTEAAARSGHAPAAAQSRARVDVRVRSDVDMGEVASAFAPLIAAAKCAEERRRSLPSPDGLAALRAFGEAVAAACSTWLFRRDVRRQEIEAMRAKDPHPNASRWLAVLAAEERHETPARAIPAIFAALDVFDRLRSAGYSRERAAEEARDTYLDGHPYCIEQWELALAHYERTGGLG